MNETVIIEKLVHGGQGLATMADGKRVFVWNALPGESVEIRVIKQKRSYAEAIAEKIITPSPDRQEPRDANYLATSPWQIVLLPLEDSYKAGIVHELFAHEQVTLPEFTVISGQEWCYRNKMEYSFWGDEDGLHLALHQRGSHGKQIVTGSSLAMPEVDLGANGVLAELQKIPNLRAGDLKTIIIRASQNGEVAGALFVKKEDFYELSLPQNLKGLKVYYSNPKSPASVATKLLYTVGDTSLTDAILGCNLHYDAVGFFQVNIPVFEQALAVIAENIKGQSSVDLYSGVGSIGIPLQSRVLVELDPANVAMAKRNSVKGEVVQASSENVLEYITGQDVVIVDPPRAGLHKEVVYRLLDAKPPMVVYLSCNPATQARDLALLRDEYEVKQFGVYNFFPHTPHIETLAILVKR